MVSKLPKFLGNDILFHAIIHSNIKDVVGLLDGQEANVNVQNVNGDTPLHVAVDQQNAIIVQILLKYGADPNIQEHDFVGGKTPLHIAVQKNNYEVCQQLLEYGADPSRQSFNGFTSLHDACRIGNKEIAKLLISNGVDINLRDKNGFNASYWAKTMKHLFLLELLPPPKCITPQDYYEFKQQLREIHDFTVKVKLKGSKKKKKKKKKK